MAPPSTPWLFAADARGRTRARRGRCPRSTGAPAPYRARPAPEREAAARPSPPRRAARRPGRSPLAAAARCRTRRSRPARPGACRAGRAHAYAHGPLVRLVLGRVHELLGRHRRVLAEGAVDRRPAAAALDPVDQAGPRRVREHQALAHVARQPARRRHRDIVERLQRLGAQPRRHVRGAGLLQHHVVDHHDRRRALVQRARRPPRRRAGSVRRRPTSMPKRWSSSAWVELVGQRDLAQQPGTALPDDRERPGARVRSSRRPRSHSVLPISSRRLASRRQQPEQLQQPLLGRHLARRRSRDPARAARTPGACAPVTCRTRGRWSKRELPRSARRGGRSPRSTAQQSRRRLLAVVVSGDQARSAASATIRRGQITTAVVRFSRARPAPPAAPPRRRRRA